MKLSRMSTRQMMDCLADIAVPLDTLSKHPAIKSFMQQNKDAEIDYALFTDFLLSAIPVVCRDCRAEFIRVASVLLDMSIDDVLDMNAFKLIKEVKEAFQDEDFIAFFRAGK